MQQTESFSQSLLSWYLKQRRSLPWRTHPSVFGTWVSEVMSQQTTLAVVVPRYLAFLEQFPNETSLFKSCIVDQNEDLLRRLWQGLGYYARARNLIKGVRYVIEDCSGVFPRTYDSWLQVPGVGPYTASVLASVHNGQSVACVDGNVTRVVARVFALSKPQDVWTQSAQLKIKSHAQHWMNQTAATQDPGNFNQAMMELGATTCTKHNPSCHSCPVVAHCKSYKDEAQFSCPPPKPKREKIEVLVTALVFEVPATANQDAKYFVTLRNKGFLKQTLGFPLIRSDATGVGPKLSGTRAIGSHTITHHNIELWTFRLAVSESIPPVLLSQDNEDHQALQSVARECDLSSGHFVTFDDLANQVSSSLDVKVLKWLKKVPGVGC